MFSNMFHSVCLDWLQHFETSDWDFFSKSLPVDLEIKSGGVFVAEQELYS